MKLQNLEVKGNLSRKMDAPAAKETRAYVTQVNCNAVVTMTAC